METRKFIIGEKEIDVKVDVGKREIYLSQKEMSILFDKSTNNITQLLKLLKKDSVSEKISHTETYFSVTGNDGKMYNVKHYNQDIILQVGYKCNIGVANAFKEWVDTLFKEDDMPNASNNWLSEANNYEIVKFESGEVSLDVNVSPNEDTVWLSRQQIAILFDRDIKTISKHINSALEEECKGATVANFATVQIEGNRNVLREIEYFNLDIVLSVGYRVKSQRGIEFRKWATNVLKQYLIKGYAINTKRCMEHSDILTGLSSKVMELSNSIHEVKTDNDNIKNSINDVNEKIEKVMTYFNDPSLHKHYIFKNGDRLVADNAYQLIYSQAKYSILLIDDYIDVKTLLLIEKCNPNFKNINVVVISDNLANNDIDLKFIKMLNKDTKINITFKQNKKMFHDRYIIIDFQTNNEMIYHCGGSSKDAGKRITEILKMEDTSLYTSSIQIVLSNPDLIIK